MGFNVLFPWNSLRIGRSAWFEQFIVVVFLAFFCSSAFSADRPFTTENQFFISCTFLRFRQV